MSTLKLEVITGERVVFSDDVDLVVAPGADGELGILPHHAALLTSLRSGELRAKKGSDEVSMVVTGGFLEVCRDKVVVLADAAERAEEIDASRAEAARQRAAERLAEQRGRADLARAEASLARSLARLKVAEKRRRRQR